MVQSFMTEAQLKVCWRPDFFS
ncbi:hypothetical protein NC653_019357 [Populus alba x Populus x berolinensis]|uniref:Uncharacterized protein n=1 Tax=Populus alba x Populus x berolinensis TaxID=444605 RepID=A0AAD6QIS2_9ROSI|nr:hypothetical protein NC653_019357 [Populus alba x Populus x berolinensis]